MIQSSKKLLQLIQYENFLKTLIIPVIFIKKHIFMGKLYRSSRHNKLMNKPRANKTQTISGIHLEVPSSFPDDGFVNGGVTFPSLTISETVEKIKR